MKHLKRILIVMVVLAMLVTSAFAVIAADDDPVAKLEEYVATAKQDADAKARSITLRDLFAYHNTVTWSGTEAGYAEAMAEAYALVVSTGEEIEKNIVDEIAGENRLATIESYVKLMNAHFLGCDVPAGTAGLAEILAKLEARNIAALEEGYAAYENAGVLSEKRVKIQNLINNLNSVYPIADAEKVSKYKGAALAVVNALLAEYDAIPDKDAEITDELITKAITDNAAKANMDVKEYAAKAFYFQRTNNILLIKNLVDSANFEASAEVNTAVQAFKAFLAARNSEVDEKRLALDELADFDSYSLPEYFNKTYDGTLTAEQIGALSKDEKTKYQNANEVFKGVNAAAEHSTAQVFETVDGKTNGYQTFIHGNGSTIPHLYIEPALNGKAEDYGMVVDFDQRLFENFADKNGFSIYSIDNSFGPGNSKFYTFINFKRDANNGNVIYLMNTPNDSQIARSNFYGAVELDIWVHYTFTYDAERRTGALYVNYEKVLDIYYSPDYAIRGWRWGPTMIANFRWDIDNVKFYGGTDYRVLDKFDKMTDGEQFRYFTDYAANEKFPYISRDKAYKRAEVLYAKFKDNGAYASTVATFDSIRYEEDIKKNAMVENLANLTVLVKELVGAEALSSFENLTDEEKAAELEKYPGIKVDSSNIAAINNKIASINEFVSDYGDLINKGDTAPGGYQELIGAVYTMQANIKRLENAVSFVGAVEKFERATTLAALTRHALSAEQIYTLAAYDDVENRAYIENDIVVRTFESRYNNTVTLADGTTVVLAEGQALAKDGTVVELAKIDPEKPIELEFIALTPADDEYVTIFEYYSTFAEIMALREKYENSRRICNCVDFILDLDGFENTVEFYEANYETISSYMNIVRDMVRTNAYDPDYAGVTEALEVFDELDIYFYKLLQREHIAYIEELLGRYPVKTAYIEKLSIVRSMRDYFDTEDLAVSNTTISAEVAEVITEEKAELERLELVLAVYESEIEGLAETFEDVLEQQTQYFINTVNHMKTLKDLVEIKALYETATIYYYGINVNTVGAPEAIAVYNEYRAMLAEASENALLFTAAADKLADAEELSGMEKLEAIYTALKECAATYENIDDTSTSVKVAITSYKMALADFLSENAAFNDAIFESEQITNAVRSGKISATVLAVISSIIAAN